MSKLLLYADEDACEHAVIRGLRARNIDVLTTIEANRSGTSDPAQLAFAASIGRALYTFNVGDFAKLHHEYLARSSKHSGIVVIPDQRCSVGEKVRRLAGLASRIRAEAMINRMEYP